MIAIHRVNMTPNTPAELILRTYHKRIETAIVNLSRWAWRASTHDSRQVFH